LALRENRQLAVFKLYKAHKEDQDEKDTRKKKGGVLKEKKKRVARAKGKTLSNPKRERICPSIRKVLQRPIRTKTTA